MRGLDGSPRVHGNVATFAASDGASVVDYEAKGSGVKESIVLDRAPTSAPSYVFDLDVSKGLSPQLTDAGAVALVRPDGSTPYTMPAPFMSDSAATPVTSTAVSYGLRRQGHHWVLSVTPDRSWLTDQDRVYPVVVDPSL